MERSRTRGRIEKAVVAAAIFFSGVTAAGAHPGSGIIVDAQEDVFFVDTGRGVWKLDAQGKLTLIHRRAYHWMALDEEGHFATSRSLGEFDRGSFERITPAGARPSLIVSSDYPIAVGQDGGLYYVPYNRNGPRELIRRMPDGQRSVFARLPSAASVEPMQWVNGIASGPDGSLYVTDDDAIRKIDRAGTVSTFREAIRVPDCPDPLADAPQPPYLRGLAVAQDGTLYAAANGCRALIAIPAHGPVTTVLQAERPWSPTGVALSGSNIYVLEYIHIATDDRRRWAPRVRKITPDRRVTTVATLEGQKN